MRGPIVLVVVIVIAMLIGVGIGIGGGLFLAPPDKSAEAVKPAAVGNPPPEADLYYDLPELTITLSDEEVGGHFVRTSLTIECVDQAGVTAVQTYLPRLLDALQVFVQQQTLAGLRGRQRVETFKAKLVETLNGVLGAGKVKAVRFRAFTIL